MTQGPNLEEEFREFVAARSAALLRTAYLLAGGDRGNAEDLLQTALTKTYLAWKRLGGIEAIEPYARRVLVNTATSWWRRRWHGERPTEVLPERPGPDRHEEALDRDAIWQEVRALPARQRAVLVLRFYEDMSEAQTAELLEISPGTVKSQTSRALATLRKRLGDVGFGPVTAPLPSLAGGATAPRPVPAPRAPVYEPDPVPDRGRASQPEPASGREGASERPEPEPVREPVVPGSRRPAAPARSRAGE